MNACTPRKFVVIVNCSPKYWSICGDLFEIHIFLAAVNKYSHTLHIKHCAITLLYLSLEDVHVFAVSPFNTKLNQMISPKVCLSQISDQRLQLFAIPIKTNIYTFISFEERHLKVKPWFSIGWYATLKHIVVFPRLHKRN